MVGLFNLRILWHSHTGRLKTANRCHPALVIEDEIFKINQPRPHRFAIQPAGE